MFFNTLEFKKKSHNIRDRNGLIRICQDDNKFRFSFKSNQSILVLYFFLSRNTKIIDEIISENEKNLKNTYEICRKI